MTHLLVSVIIPAYKAEKYIEETLRSVMNQTYRNLEIIVVDDGSPDSLGEVVKRLQSEDTRIQYVRQKNAGVSAARNHGYRLAKGDYFAFLDADDVWLSERIVKMLAKFGQDSEFGLVHTDMAIIDQNSQHIGQSNQGKEGWVLDDLLLWNACVIPAPSSILVKKAVLEKVGLFDVQLSTAADQEFFFRVAAQYKIGRIAEALGLYRVHQNNMSKNIALLEKDHELAYQKAKANKLFRNKIFERKCFSNMYMIMAGNWWKDAGNKKKGLYFIAMALCYYPANISKLIKKAV